MEVSICLYLRGTAGGGIGSRHRNPPTAVCTSPQAGNFWVLKSEKGDFRVKHEPQLRSGCWVLGAWPQQLRMRKAPEAFPKVTGGLWGGFVHEMMGDLLAFKVLSFFICEFHVGAAVYHSTIVLGPGTPLNRA